ncbi:glutathione S-transferase [Duganella sp. LX20W]|uniref:Glutathione S-transferase n=1 Tax=Rugamonas brunnea TaxID=2758569 RepID=A0A7W2IBM0_9BURK|nr:glutathione S-transferase [Rugamonas brunnea]MBA5637616.1 glutathione S-transferase [Rugamonas brunnea]
MTTPAHTPTLTLHGTHLSGHVHRVELLLHMLGLPYELVAAPPEVRAGAAFRAMNPLGQIPVLQDGDLALADSNAILTYLARRYAPDGGWLSDDPVVAAEITRWLSVAAGELRFGPAAARANALWNLDADVPRAHAIAARVLAFMEQHLAARTFLAAGRPTLADVACYAYVARAPEGGVALDAYPAVRAWLQRVEALPGFVPMPESTPPVRT